jgi:transcriptional regulator with XRE-family HTH domain
MDIRMVVGLNVQRLRRERGLSQEELSFRSGFTRAYLSGLETGRRNPTVVSLVKLAAALDAEIEALIRVPLKAPSGKKRVASQKASPGAAKGGRRKAAAGSSS